MDDLFRVIKGIASNIDPSGLVKAADGIATLASGAVKLASGEEDALTDIATGGGKVLTGTGTLFGFIKSDSDSDDSE
jgi:X-X-X-Leu-X-X-Gly heptad repeat protein